MIKESGWQGGKQGTGQKKEDKAYKIGETRLLSNTGYWAMYETNFSKVILPKCS
uniref:Uncharacterized protein n=1 Tax=Nelumbo nucifera TaxID=4432 RepID=A0A822ZVA7_NELNU|nr:TPA_asm: hypothetical protein HUJ06_017166 [Nelumbo nucifera]